MSFREFKGKEGINYRIRLGNTVYVTTYELKEIFVERNGQLIKLTPAQLTEKSWIMRNLQQEISFQRRKEMAIMLDQPCFKREIKYSRNQRIAYNNAKSNGAI
jgi:hypothetical protein